jgi:hypothetical protein
LDVRSRSGANITHVAGRAQYQSLSSQLRSVVVQTVKGRRLCTATNFPRLASRRRPSLTASRQKCAAVENAEHACSRQSLNPRGKVTESRAGRASKASKQALGFCSRVSLVQVIFVQKRGLLARVVHAPGRAAVRRKQLSSLRCCN